MTIHQLKKFFQIFDFVGIHPLHAKQLEMAHFEVYSRYTELKKFQFNFLIKKIFELFNLRPEAVNRAFNLIFDVFEHEMVPNPPFVLSTLNFEIRDFEHFCRFFVLNRLPTIEPAMNGGHAFAMEAVLLHISPENDQSLNLVKKAKNVDNVEHNPHKLVHSSI